MLVGGQNNYISIFDLEKYSYKSLKIPLIINEPAKIEVSKTNPNIVAAISSQGLLEW